MRTLRGIGLSLLLLVGAVGLIATSVADFNAQTTNASTFSSGTLVLSDARTGGTTCLSTGGATTDTNNNSTGCDDLMGATVQRPGSAATARVVTNAREFFRGAAPTIYAVIVTLWPFALSEACNPVFSTDFM